MILSSMAPSKLLCLLLFLLSLRTRAQTNSSSGIIRLGSSLYANSGSSSWLSPSRRFAFGFYPQGNGFAVGIWLISKPNITVVWTANRDDPPVSPNSSTIHFTKDGKFLLRTDHGKEIPVIELYDVVAASASMLDSGNFIIYGNNNEVIWESFDWPTNTILGGQTMYWSIVHELISSNSEFDHSSGRYRLQLTEEGLLSYPVNRTGLAEEHYWSFLTEERPWDLNLSRSGVLQLSIENKTIQIIARSSYSVENENVIYRATLDADGILRLYAHRLEITGTSNVTVEWTMLKIQRERQW